MAPEDLQSLARSAEAAGLDELWVWEDSFKHSGIASAAAALSWTETIQVRIGLLPVPLRNVALTAMELATLDRLFPARFAAGVGHGVQAWMAQAGVRVGSPMTLLREYAVALRRLLNGERVSVEGRYVRLDDVALEWPPLSPPPLFLGGDGPKSLALAGELGDGVLLSGNLSHAQTEEACRVAADAAGHPTDVTATLIAASGPGAQERVDNEVRAWGAEPAPGRGVAGGAHEIAEAMRDLGRLGVSAVVIQPTRDEPDLTGFVAVLGKVHALLAA
jgi:alkanesulfonate monooxygenase SsuD/methylene tetrahydromethanopterin reductase-like flavin-dependent oxidoreductase (luciferase family)